MVEVERIEMVDTSPAKIHAHIDIINTCHIPIADTPENRKIFEDYICSICAKVRCTGKGRCRSTAKTFAQLNLLTPLVVLRDEGSAELDIESFDRVVTIGQALRPFNPLLADYFCEEDVLMLHTLICLAKNKDSNISLGKLVIPKKYNVRIDKILD